MGRKNSFSFYHRVVVGFGYSCNFGGVICFADYPSKDNSSKIDL
jgi:hypothetical protein